MENNIKEIKEEGYLVIVEGRKDKEALNELGIDNVIYLKNRPLFEIVEDINERDVVILTDLDVEGRKIFNKLRYLLQRRRIRLHNQIRNTLFRTRLRNIEGLNNYLKKDSHIKLFDF